MRKIFYRTPGGETRVRYERRKSKKKSCEVCGGQIQGKRPGRKYSQKLCPKCLEEFLKAKARAEEGQPMPLKFKHLLKE